MSRRIWLGLALVCAGSLSAQGAPTLTVGSKNFTESRILAEIMAQLIEARTEITVARRSNLGGTAIVFRALLDGEIDVYPEYTGTGWAVQLGRSDPVSSPLRAFTIVQKEFRSRFGVEWLAPFGFNNSYAITMLEARADQLGVTRVSQLSGFERELTAGFTHEFLNREDGYPGLASRYQIDLSDVRGMEHGLAYDALASGRVDLIDTYTTDGKLLRYPIRLLEDDLGFFPPYQAAPIVRADVLRENDGLRSVLNELAFRIDDDTMRRLNARVEDEGGSFADVATAFLSEAGLTSDVTDAGLTTATNQRFLPYIWNTRSELISRTLRHTWLTLISVVLASALAIPLALFVANRRKTASVLMSSAGVLQTIPSLALLAFMIPVPGLGLGARSAVAALFLYAILPILKNTYVGLTEVDGELIDAARGMGLTKGQILRNVQLPLAAPTIMAGVRVATVISIGVATLAAFIGAGGLGDPILTGLQLNNTVIILSGAVPAALLALFADFVLARVESAVRPKGI